ncbi:MAG: hypothetical protein IPN53_00010 [Comamonadaceae bacterium]|nr:hypothetical protein [Comamonadaceae bacterium]
MKPPRPALPASAQWLQGDWYLAPPQRPTTAQSASRALALKLLQLRRGERKPATSGPCCGKTPHLVFTTCYA